MKNNKDAYTHSIRAAMGKLFLFDRSKNELVLKQELIGNFLDDAFYTYEEALNRPKFNKRGAK